MQRPAQGVVNGAGGEVVAFLGQHSRHIPGTGREFAIRRAQKGDQRGGLRYPVNAEKAG